MNKDYIGDIKDLVRLEEALLKNEALVSSLCAKWHGKPENIGRDIYIIADTLYNLNFKNSIETSSQFELNE
jgi:hypothetical protein